MSDYMMKVLHLLIIALSTLERSTSQVTIGFDPVLYTVNEFELSTDVNIAVLTGTLNGNVELNVQVIDGTAEFGVDYSGRMPSSITLNSTVRSQQIMFSIVDDPFVERDEDFHVAVSLLTNSTESEVTIDPPMATVVINSDGNAVLVFVTEARAVEGSSVTLPLQYREELSSGTIGPNILVNIHTIDSLAIGGVDYVEVNSTLVFNASTLSHNITISLLNDSAPPERPENFFVEARLFAGFESDVSILPNIAQIVIIDESFVTTEPLGEGIRFVAPQQVSQLAHSELQLYCVPFNTSLSVQWYFNEIPLLSDGRNGIQFSTNRQTLSVRVSRIFHSGNYSCTIEGQSFSTAMHTVVEILPACPFDTAGGVQWQNTAPGLMAEIQCSFISSLFSTLTMIRRYCREDEWDLVDYSGCTLDATADPFMLVWFTLNASTTSEVQSIQNELLSQVGNDLLIGVQSSGVFLNSINRPDVSVVIRVDFAGVPVKEEDVKIVATRVDNATTFTQIRAFSVAENGRGVAAFIPSDVCYCGSQNTSLTGFIKVCGGSNLPPCLCNSGQGCSCSTPFVGNGVVCTLDWDRDGYADTSMLGELICSTEGTANYCTMDTCQFLRDQRNDPNACNPDYNGDGTCPLDMDLEWRVTWSTLTEVGETDVQSCPGAPDSNGDATRLCMEGGEWGNVDVSLCESQQFRAIRIMAETMFADNTTTAMQVTEVIQTSIATIADQLELQQSLLPLDVNSSVTVVSNAIGFLVNRFFDVDLDDNSVSQTLLGQKHVLVNLMSNIIDSSNTPGWIQLTQMDVAASQTLLTAIETFGVYLGKFASGISENDTINNCFPSNPSSSVLIQQSNIVVLTQLVSSSNNALEIFSFDMPGLMQDFEGSASIGIPFNFSDQFAAETLGGEVLFVNILMRNFGDYLPIIERNGSETEVVTNVLSSQVASPCDFDYNSNEIIFSNLLEENPIILEFTSAQLDNTMFTQPSCVFWQFSDAAVGGVWSEEGIAVIEQEGTRIRCNSTHLTSFAVLVDISGITISIPKAEIVALSVFTYVGCSISIVCLLLTVLFIIILRKKIFSAVNNFIHLNLALSLLVGLVIFIIGIELGASNEIACKIIAAVLQYFFLSAFCWMLCEAILLYLLIVIVFTSVARRVALFLILGWGLPIIPVAISFGVGYPYYGIKDANGTLKYCWLSTENGTIWAFVAPMLCVILVNTVILIIVLVKLLQHRKSKVNIEEVRNRTVVKLLFKASIILLPLLGITWVIGLFAVNLNTTIFAWLFTILNSLQGAFIFIFHVILNEKFQATCSALWKSRTTGGTKSDSKQVTQDTGLKDSKASGQDGTILKTTLKQMVADLDSENHHAADLQQNVNTQETEMTLG